MIDPRVAGLLGGVMPGLGAGGDSSGLIGALGGIGPMLLAGQNPLTGPMSAYSALQNGGLLGSLMGPSTTGAPTAGAGPGGPQGMPAPGLGGFAGMPPMGLLQLLGGQGLLPGGGQNVP